MDAPEIVEGMRQPEQTAEAVEQMPSVIPLVRNGKKERLERAVLHAAAQMTTGSETQPCLCVHVSSVCVVYLSSALLSSSV